MNYIPRAAVQRGLASGNHKACFRAYRLFFFFKPKHYLKKGHLPNIPGDSEDNGVWENNAVSKSQSKGDSGELASEASLL